MSATTTRSSRVKRAVDLRRLKRSEIWALVFSGVMVALAVALVLRVRGIAATHTEQVLDCHYAGTGAHTHDASCYDSSGNLVCPLVERKYHVHDASCYTETRELVCGLAESAGHTHTDDCYDEDGTLTCGLEESASHVHSDACYEVTRTLSCGKEEVTETHTHGPGCFMSVTVEDESVSGEVAADTADPSAAAVPVYPQVAEAPVQSTTETMPAQQLEGVLRERDTEGNEWVALVVGVKAPEGALPAGTSVKVDWVDSQTLEDKTLAALAAYDPQVTGTAWAYAVNVKLVDIAGNEVKPVKKVEVKISHDGIRTAENPLMVRVLDAEDLAARPDAKEAWVSRKAKVVNQLDEDTTTGSENTFRFETRVPCTYVLVDATYEAASDEDAALAAAAEGTEVAEGVVAEVTEPEELVAEQEPAEAEATDAEQSEPAEPQVFTGEANGVTVTAEAPAGAFADDVQMTVAAVDADEVKPQVEAAVDSDFDQVGDLAAVDIAFVDGEGNAVEPAEPVSVSLTSDVVLDAEKPVLVQVSDEPSVVEDAETVNAHSETMVGAEDTLRIENAGAGTYAVVALETLNTRVITASGETYEISVTYGPEAGIPAGAELKAEEILPETKAYKDNLDKAQTALEDENGKNSKAASPDPVIDSARFFDISIIDATGTEVHPTGSVDVQIKLAYRASSVTPKVLHFGENTEVMDVTDDGETLAFSTSGFSIYAVVVIEKDEGSFAFRGEGYTVKISYTKAAKIPFGTVLEVSEIDPASDAYIQRLGQAWSEVNKEYFEVKEQREIHQEWMGELPEVNLVNLNTARFFDITLTYEGEEIEPKVPVQVEIEYDQGLPAANATEFGVAHYKADNEVELIEDVETTLEDDAVVSYRYEQDSFSDVGTYVGQETHDLMAEPDPAPALDPYGSARLSDETVEAIMQAAANKAAKGVRAAGTETPSTSDSYEPKPVATKTLTANTDGEGQKDGTYTLTLTVKGSSSTSTDSNVKKSNILFVMDRSSSMITHFVNDETSYWYYGTRNTALFRGDINPGKGYQFYGEVNGVKVPLVAYDTYYGPPPWYQQYIGESNLDWNATSANTFFFVYVDPATGQSVTYPGDAPLYVRSKTTRMVAEQNALNNLFAQLANKNEASGSNSDIVEMAIISFGDQRFDLKSWSSETETGWVGGRDISTLTTAASSNRFTSGTNWEEALQYASDIISAKKAQDGTDEDYYVVFLTDGEPTAVEGNEPNQTPHTGSGPNGNIYAYDHAKDEAKALVDSGVKFYNIFTYRTNEDETYSIYLTNYAYGNGNHNGDKTTDAVKNYFADARTPDDVVSALNNIFSTVESSIGHANVSITDTLTTDAMTTTIVHGKTNGYVYKVTNPSGTELYSVTATGDLSNPTVTFNVPGSTTTTYTATPTTVGDKTVYSVTTDEGNTYKMALADVDNETGELVWDLSPVGMLMNQCTYSVNFIVWPEQDAYDYVAALNNRLTSITNSKGETVEVEWDDDAAQDSGKGYFVGGVDQYPSIVKYPGGTYAVLTNKDQQLHYSVVETEVINGVASEPVVTGPFYTDLPLPDPMPLEASKSSIEKVWNVSRDPSIFAALLYPANEEHYTLTFDVMQGTSTTPYTTVHLGWDESQNKYVWEPTSVQTVNYHGKEVEIGTRWVEEFSIATGLMLSTERMDALGLDKSAYPSAVYGDTTYYILETGHDYTIKERAAMGYEFDFIAPVYHPMLVDGVLENVTLAESGGAITISEIEAIDVANGTSSLKVENTLRGYIHLNKVVVDKEGNPVPSDTTKFTYEVELYNAGKDEEKPFTGTHIPWYGVNELFYHDASFNYYQVDNLPDGSQRLTTETGGPYVVTSTGFNVDLASAQQIAYRNDNGEEITLTLYGNQMAASSDGKTATATLKISQSEVLNIANVPAGTTYEITEVNEPGYELKSLTWEVKDGGNPLQNNNGKLGDTEIPVPTVSGPTISGTIVTNCDNHAEYTNQRNVANLEILKVDKDSLDKEEKVYLEGAEFTFTKLDEAGSGNYKPSAEDSTKPEYQETFTSDENGKISISGLQPGYYEIVETKAPDGYILTSQPEYIKVELGVVTRISKVADDPNTTNANEGLVAGWPENTDNSGTIRFASARQAVEDDPDTPENEARAATEATYLIGNEAGAELPAAGGPGTFGLLLAGAAMMMAGAAAIIRRRA